MKRATIADCDKSIGLVRKWSEIKAGLVVA